MAVLHLGKGPKVRPYDHSVPGCSRQPAPREGRPSRSSLAPITTVSVRESCLPGTLGWGKASLPRDTSHTIDAACLTWALASGRSKCLGIEIWPNYEAVQTEGIVIPWSDALLSSLLRHMWLSCVTVAAVSRCIRVNHRGVAPQRPLHDWPAAYS